MNTFLLPTYDRYIDSCLLAGDIDVNTLDCMLMDDIDAAMRDTRRPAVILTN